MLVSEFIVGLWFLPVVLFILIPLAMFSVWLLHQLLGAINEKSRLLHTSEKKASGKGFAPLRTKPAV